MIPVPELPRWQQYLLLAGAVLAVMACVCLRKAGWGQGLSLLPLILPFQLWWPQPTTFERHVYWWLMTLLLFGVNVGFLCNCAP